MDFTENPTRKSHTDPSVSFLSCLVITRDDISFKLIIYKIHFFAGLLIKLRKINLLRETF